MTYTMKMEIYAGKQPAGPYCLSNKPTDVVRRMVEPIVGTGRNITADNWFTDVDLVDELRKKKLSYVGTLRKNKSALPPDFVNVKGRKQYSSMFAFNDGKVLRKKPEIVTFYNQTKSGVDTADQMCMTYSVSRNTKRWPMVIFFAMLNVGGINSQVIYMCNELQPLRRRMYLKKLANELVYGELQRRSMKTTGIPSSLQVRLKRYRPSADDDREKSPTQEPPKRRKCITCAAETGHRRLSNYECHDCHEAICLSHANMVCQGCTATRQQIVESESESD
ncbi:uncharacterized protein LOC120354770 [Nilaparvata lugens]|uniref:uncharacterized protein LOC120354770 n=1 Tax=Nilaparvata lugens TaxID=108931 RepID=UPI00193E2E05|nr:uncharacterized protein LOC120354770 [Nilaparvata lugens]